MCTDLDLGTGLLERWAASRQTAAEGVPRVAPWRRSPDVLSSVFVHRVQQHRHDAEDAFYAMRNLYVDPAKRVRVLAAPTGGPRLSIERGAFRVACRPTRAWREAPAPLTLASIKKALCFGPLQPARVDDVATLFVSRDGAANVFHAMADVLNAYLVRRMFDYRRIVLLDDHADGPLMPLWRLLSEQPILRFHQLPEARVLTDAAFGPPGGSSFLWKNHWGIRDECRRPAPLLQQFRCSMLERLGLAEAEPPARIVLVTRRSPTRRIANEAQLLAALRALGAEVETVDFSALAYLDQIRAVSRSRVLVGVTGAGLTNLIWLESIGGVVELAPAPTFAPAVFGNLAAWRGVRHALWLKQPVSPMAARLGPDVEEFTVDVDAVAALVASMLR